MSCTCSDLVETMQEETSMTDFKKVWTQVVNCKQKHTSLEDLLIEKLSNKAVEQFNPEFASDLKTYVSALKTNEPEKREDYSESLGKNSESLGKNPESLGKNPESLGKNSESLGKNPESLGKNSESLGKNSESLGKNSESSGENSDSMDLTVTKILESYIIEFYMIEDRPRLLKKNLIIEERSSFVLPDCLRGEPTLSFLADDIPAKIKISLENNDNTNRLTAEAQSFIDISYCIKLKKETLMTKNAYFLIDSILLYVQDKSKNECVFNINDTTYSISKGSKLYIDTNGQCSIDHSRSYFACIDFTNLCSLCPAQNVNCFKYLLTSDDIDRGKNSARYSLIEGDMIIFGKLLMKIKKKIN